jgi:predicted AAA+ superfamily ATPase
MLYPRHIVHNVLKSLKKNPVALINGARQVGKSTLIKTIETLATEQETHISQYISLDDHNILLAMQQDAYGTLQHYIGGTSGILAIDEVQRCPALFMAIKRCVDQSARSPNTRGQFLLTGSANVLTIPRISESLSGRMIIHPLWPLSQGELLNTQESFLSWLWTNHLHLRLKHPILTPQDLITRIFKGGYPRLNPAHDLNIDLPDHNQWIQSYLDTLIQRDIRSLANIEGLTELPHLLSIVAERTGSLLNFADLARALKINQVTLKRYYTLLQMVFLVVEVPPWFANREKRVVKAPKVYLNDTALLSYFMQLDPETVLKHRTHLGPLLENFVVMELKKQISWHEAMINLYHFRTYAGHEVDIVLEGYGKKIVGIEIKSSSTLSQKDLKGLIQLKETAKDQFLRGIILYTGDQILPLGTDIMALPLQALWDLKP